MKPHQTDTRHPSPAAFQGTMMMQLPLFPWPCGSALSFSVVERPCKGIARALIEPVNVACLGSNSTGSTTSVRVLACTDDGLFIAAITSAVSTSDIKDPWEFWRRVHDQITNLRVGRVALSSASSPLSLTPDCLQSWENHFSISASGDPIHPVARFKANLLPGDATPTDEALQSERMAQRELSTQVWTGIQLVVDALDRNLCAILRKRPAVSFSTINYLLSLARFVGPEAVRYTYQFLRTEPLWCLDLASTLDQAGCDIRHVIFHGGSLPRALANLGVSKAIHRWSVKCESSASPTPVADFPVSWVAFKKAAPLLATVPFDRWPRSGPECHQLFSVVFAVLELDVEVKVAADLLRWCLVSGYAEAEERLQTLLARVRSFSRAAKNLAGVQLAARESLLLAFATAKGSRTVLPLADVKEMLATKNCAVTVMMLATFLGIPAGDLTNAVLFQHHPGLPARGFGWRPYVVRGLDTLARVVAHGLACDVCTQEAATAIDYAASSGAAIFAIDWWNGIPLATVALGFDEATSRIVLLEISGMGNTSASVVLDALCQDLVDSYDTEDLRRWIAYSRQCVQFRILVEGAP